MTKNDKLKNVEASQPEEALSGNGQDRRSFLKHASKAVYVTPLLFVLPHNVSAEPPTAPGKIAPGRTPPGKDTPQQAPMDQTMSIVDPPPPPGG